MAAYDAAVIGNKTYDDVQEAMRAYSTVSLDMLKDVCHFKLKSVDNKTLELNKYKKAADTRKRKMEIFKANADLFIEEIVSYKTKYEKADLTLENVRKEKKVLMKNTIAAKAVLIHKTIQQLCKKVKIEPPTNTEMRLLMCFNDNSTPINK